MLIGIDPRLSPEALHALAAMGHGDSLTIVDANFPAYHAGSKTPYGKHVDFAGTAIEALEAILALIPLDPFDPERPPVRAMIQVDTPDVLAGPVADALPLIRAKGFDIAMTERFAFYAAAAESFVIVRTRERRFYGNFLLRKGVIAP
jgi:L-fucose mutarotase